MRVIVGITGASGVVLGIRLVEELANRGHEVHAVVTASAWAVIRHEMGEDVKLPAGVAAHSDKDLGSPLMSSSFPVDAMVVVPCSMKTLAGMATGYADTVIVRAADTMLRMGKRLVVAPRETPLSLSALENMAALKRGGAVILPPVVGYYHHPKTAADMTDFLVGKMLDVLGIENKLYERWHGSGE